jgi:hypothetical protein
VRGKWKDSEEGPVPVPLGIPQILRELPGHELWTLRLEDSDWHFELLHDLLCGVTGYSDLCISPSAVKIAKCGRRNGLECGGKRGDRKCIYSFGMDNFFLKNLHCGSLGR